MKIIQKMFVAFIILVGLGSIQGQNVFMDENQVANKGYDVVNYFTAHSAQRGMKDFSATHNGAIYYFVNAENLQKFESAPEDYLPQYDGYCSFAIAKMNKKVPVDPKTFRIDDGKLYLFYNDFWEGKPFNTIVPWINNEAAMEKMARANWEALKSK